MGDAPKHDATIVAERHLCYGDVIDIPVPTEEFRASIDENDVVHVQDIALDAGHFSRGYRRC
jgi:hypothetical protein